MVTKLNFIDFKVVKFDFIDLIVKLVIVIVITKLAIVILVIAILVVRLVSCFKFKSFIKINLLKKTF